MAAEERRSAISRRLLFGGLASLGLAAGAESIGLAATSGVTGAWNLETFDERVADGSFKPRFGPHPVGYLIYTASGRMSAVLAAAHRPPFKSPDAAGSSPSERTEAVRNFLAYAGRYEIHGSEVLHHVETSIFTNLVGTTLRRGFQLKGDRLVIRTLPPYIWGTESTLVWRRA